MDACTGKKVEEVAAANMFFVLPDKVVTPALGTILPGITRDSICQLIKDLGQTDLGGRTLVEGTVTLDDMEKAEEAFCCGTATVITPIEYIAEHG